MADDRDDQTEQATEKKLQQAYDEGQIAISRDAVTLAGMAGCVGALVLSASKIGDQPCTLMGASLLGIGTSDIGTLGPLALKPVLSVLGVAAAASGAALVATVAQTRGGFWPDLLGPNFDKLVSGGGLKRVFSSEIYADMAMSVVKLVAIGGTVWMVISGGFMTLPNQVGIAPENQFHNLLELLTKFAKWTGWTLLLTAGADFALSHFRFRARLKMSREETKRERREEEGDPLLRSRRRRRHRELSKGRAAAEVPKADVVVVNPTHIAIAIRYRRGSDRAPRVLAKGKGQLAELIRDLAHANAIPIVEDIPLARFLHRRVKVGGVVPAETYKAVAAVLAFVYRSTRHANSGARR
jgi:flagellar biosynthesis protein FlhB